MTKHKNWNAQDYALFEKVLAEVRAFFIIGRPEDLPAAGTRAMVSNYVARRVGQEVPELMVSAALVVLKDSNAIIFDKRVWWFLSDR